MLYSINFSTNAAAQITGYQFTTQTDVVAPDLIPYEYPPTIYLEEVFSFDLPGVLCCEDGIYIPQIFQDSAYASNADDPGTWAVTSVPELLGRRRARPRAAPVAHLWRRHVRHTVRPLRPRSPRPRPVHRLADEAAEHATGGDEMIAR